MLGHLPRRRLFCNNVSKMIDISAIGFTGKDSGCGYHRVLMPLAYMSDITGHVTNALTPERTHDWDILLYNRISPFDDDWQFVRDQLNCKVVLDLDDWWKLPPNHIQAEMYDEFAVRIIRNIGTADWITCSSHALYDKIIKLSDKVTLVPNALPYGHNQFIEDKEPSADGRVRLFWCGSITHEHDVAILKNPLRRLSFQKNKITMMLGGYNNSDPYSEYLWKRILHNFTGGGMLDYQVLPSQSVKTYMDLYQYADIMLIPLEESEWHGCKSNLKILEAAAKRIPCVVSKVLPYSNDADAPVLWVEKQSDWFTHLNYLINNEEARQDYGNRLHEWAKAKYDLIEINQRIRRPLFGNLCKAPTHLEAFCD